MRIFPLLILLLTSTSYGDDVPPPLTPVRIVPLVAAPVTDGPDGSRENPYVFDTSTIPILTLSDPAIKDVKWKLKDAPPGAFITPAGVAFTLAAPKADYILWATWGPDAGSDLVWFTIKGANGPPPAPTPATISSRVKAAFSGSASPATAAADADIYGGVMSLMADAVEQKRATSYNTFCAQLKAALDANKWQPNKYIDLTKMFGEMFGGEIGGPGIQDYQFSDAFVAEIVPKLRTISKACLEVSRTPPPPATGKK